MYKIQLRRKNSTDCWRYVNTEKLSLSIYPHTATAFDTRIQAEFACIHLKGRFNFVETLIIED